jgi:hypothetical protein
MQNDYGGCEPHNEYGRAKRPKSVKIIAKILPDLCNSKALCATSPGGGSRDFVATRAVSPFRTTSDAREGLS